MIRLNPNDAQTILDMLTEIAPTVAAKTVAYSNALAEAQMWKELDLADAQRAVADAEAAALMDAYASGEISGKNQAERDAQVLAYLRRNGDLARAKQHLLECERAYAVMEANVERAKGEYKAAAYRLTAARAQAELRSAMIQEVLSGMEEEPAPESYDEGPF